MRITHVSVGALPPAFTTHGGAVQRRVAELATAQAAAGHEVTVITPDRTRRTDSRSGVRVEHLRCRSDGPAMHWEFLARARRAVGRPDVIHVHNEPEGAAAFGGLGAATVLSFDNFEFRQRAGAALHRAYRHLLLGYDRLLPVSQACAAGASAHWELPADRVRVLPNGVDTSRFAPDPEAAQRERERLEIDGPLVLYLGRICRQKGTHVLLASVPLIPANVVLAGPVEQFDDRNRPHETAGWERAIDRAGATYVGRVPDDRLPGLLSTADVFVMPTVELEMQGMAALEAQACGTPVVATDHGGLPETVPDDCGIRVPPGDAPALADAIGELLADDARRAELGRRAREHAATYDWRRLADASVALYAEVVR